MQILETLVIGKALDPHAFKGEEIYLGSQATQTEHYVELTGLTSPWNTFAIWDLYKLAKVTSMTDEKLRLKFFFGYRRAFWLFPTRMSSLANRQSKKYSTIALHQRLFPNDSDAVLVRFPDSKTDAAGWNTTWYVSMFNGDIPLHRHLAFRNDPQRAAWQRSKLASKDLSAASHLQLLGLRSDPSISISRSGVRHFDLSGYLQL